MFIKQNLLDCTELSIISTTIFCRRFVRPLRSGIIDGKFAGTIMNTNEVANVEMPTE